MLAFCDDGLILEIDFPESGKFDTTHSFEIRGLKMKQSRFRSVKSRLRVGEKFWDGFYETNNIVIFINC